MKPNIFKTSMFNGLIMGVLFSLRFLLSTSKSAIFSTLSIIILVLIIAGMYKMTIHYRENQLKGHMPYWTAVNLSIMTFFFAALVSSAFKMIYTTYISPDFLSSMINDSMQALEELRPSFNIFKYIDEDEYITSLEKQMTPFNYSIQSIWMNIFSGAFLGLILGAFTKKKKSIFDEDNTELTANE